MSYAQKFMLITDIEGFEAAQIIYDSTKGLIEGRSTLIKIVQSVEEYINHENSTIRCQALEYVAKVLCQLPKDFLTRQQLFVFVEFFCARLHDKGALKALEHLQSLPRCSSDAAVAIMNALTQNFPDLRPLPQAQRYDVYSLIHSLMRHHRNTLKATSAKTLAATMEMFSGEKDPRNLMLIFSLLHAMMVEWDISAQAEELFDSVFCYFPITFTPPPNDPYGITANALKERLRDCIASNSNFAPFAFPQLMDKLDSTSANVKKDVLQTINACIKRYDRKTLAAYSLTIWDSLKFEVIAKSDDEVADDTLVVLSSMCVALQSSGQIHNAQEPLSEFINMVTADSHRYFDEPNYRYEQNISRILYAVGITSVEAFRAIANCFLPTLTEAYAKTDSYTDRRKLLETLTRILDAGISLQDHQTARLLAINGILDPFRVPIVQILTQVLANNSHEQIGLQLTVLKCLQRCCMLRGFLTESELRPTIQHLNSLLLNGDNIDRQLLYKAAANVIREISKVQFEIILENTVPFLMTQITHQASDFCEESLAALRSLALIIQEDNVRETVIRRLFSQVENLAFNTTRNQHVKAILLTLCYVLDNNYWVSKPSASTIYQKTIALVRHVIFEAYHNGDNILLIEPENAEVLSQMTQIVVRNMGTERQHEIAKNVYQLYQTDPPPVEQDRNIVADNFRKRTIIFSTAFAAGIKRNIGLSGFGERLPDLIDRFIEAAATDPDLSVRHNLHQHCCLVVNKFLSETDISRVGIVQWILHRSLEMASMLKQEQVAGVFWIAKALLLRALYVEQTMECLLGLLDKPVLKSEAARGFAMLLVDDPIICTKNGAVIRLLAKQRIWSIAISGLAKAVRSSREDYKTDYLVAFAGLATTVGSNVAWVDIEITLPLLLQGLDLRDAGVRTAALNMLLTIMLQTPQKLSEHTDSLIVRLHSVLNEHSYTTLNLRITALKSLSQLPLIIPKDKFLNDCHKVMHIISKLLDDPRRLVRKEAVDCRNKWLAFGNG